MLREMQTTTKLIRLRKNKSSLGELSLEMALPFKRKNALLNQQHLWEEIFCGFRNTKLKPIGKKRKKEKNFPLWPHLVCGQKGVGFPFLDSMDSMLKGKCLKKCFLKYFSANIFSYLFCTVLPRSHIICHMNLYTENEFKNQKVIITITLNSPTELISWTRTSHDHRWASIFLLSLFGERKKYIGIQSITY